ncbi:hypothetical protein I4U23_004637 [Adineta vaga]|nr:hypothetical protein I4U23_004637 [Adineta vaga]
MANKIINDTIDLAIRTDTKQISIPISSNGRKSCGLDWAESSWTRWIYVIFWTWLNPILNVGYKRQLNDDDLFDVSSNDECNQLLNKFETVWNKHEQKYKEISTWKIIIETFWKPTLFAGLILIPYIAVKIAQPLLIRQLILTINDPTIPSYVGYLYAIGLGLSTLLQALMHQQHFLRITRVGMHVRIALSSIIYKRLLSLPTNAILQTTTGQLVNLISNDASKFEDLSLVLHQLWSAPLEAIISFIFIWNQIGVPTLFGYGILLLLVPLQTFFSRKSGKYRKNTMEWSDKRVKVINEILVGCQIVKMYRWEEALENVVYDARKNELKNIRKIGRIRGLNMGIFFASLPLITLTTFGGSWLMGQILSATNIFTTVTFLSNIRFPMINSVPFAIGRLSESRVAAKRIAQFMNLSKQSCTKTFEKHSSHVSTCTSGNIVMSKASFVWDTTQSSQLVNIDLNVKDGSLIGIIGTIGSSKSSLLSAILGEMSLVEGTCKIDGRIAYVSQIPWLFAGTIRENILFCKSYQKEKYEQVIESCQLITDLQSFPAGDQTIIGDKAENLSEGQKVRVSLARALYTEADIYLLDDPLAAVDPSVAKNIFKHCISNEGFLKNKTRLLVTHQIQFLSELDHCVLLDHGRIEKQGTFDDLLSLEKIKQSYENQFNETKQRHDDTHVFNKDLSKVQSTTMDENSIIKEEVSIDGSTNLNVWLKLFTSGYGWFGLILLIFLMLIGQGIYDATNKWLSIWSSKIASEQRQIHYPYIYLGLVIGTWIISLIRSDYFFHLILCGASTLHNSMFKGVLYTSLRFYESNPIGRILNRFSKDQQVLDDLLPLAFYDTVQTLILVLGSLVIIGMSNPWVLLILLPILPIVIWLRRYYIRSSRSLKRLESVSRSPVYALFSSSLNGLMTIRAFNMENEFVNLFIEKVNANTRAYFIFVSSSRWFGLRLDLMTCCLTFLTAILSIVLRRSVDSSSIALSLSYCISLTSIFQWAVRQSAETENYMTSAERIDEYSRLPPEEDFYNGETKPPIHWPNEGKIQFDNYKLRYRPELEPVLKGMNLEIIPQDKVGIIGRTGAGKSSIFQALFRLIPKSTTEGKILIDGININEISLNDLRSILNIIPQSPVLFSNTLRYNLDPFQQYTDQQLWNALEAVQLKIKIENYPEKLNTQIAECGSNFSVGECQLICVARAILKPSKILLIDEATAHVDTRTDEMIQQILREKFVNQTILTIAHRVNTVMDSDKIVVMNNGFVEQYGTPNEIFSEHREFLTEMKNENNDELLSIT